MKTDLSSIISTDNFFAHSDAREEPNIKFSLESKLLVEGYQQ
jgi:hypothetical protein